MERLLEWTKDEQLALVVRVKAMEALKQAARNLPSMMATHFEHLLGYLAIVSSQELPSTSPSLIIPGQPSRPPLQDEMDTYSDARHWNLFKQHLQGCLEELCKQNPASSLDLMVECYNQPMEHVDSDFKTRCIALFSQIGKEYRLRPQVMPSYGKH